MTMATLDAPLRAEREATCAKERDGLPPFPVLRLSVERYHQMARAGILDEDDRVELLEGWLVTKMTHYPPHDATISVILEALQRLLSANWKVRVQSSITTADSEPEPDLAVVRGPARRYFDRHPGPADIGLVIEVADSSLARDRRKAKTYARAGLSTYWLVNLIDEQVEVFTQPSGDGEAASYRDNRVLRRGGELALALDGVELGRLPIDDLLPPRDTVTE
jgi:hypothetical protein